MTRHDPIALDPDPPRPDPRAPDVVRLRQGVRACFRSVVGEQALILRVDAGRKVIRGAVSASVGAGEITLMPAHLPLDVENHPAETGPYRATGLLVAPGIAAPTGPSVTQATNDSRALMAFDRALDLCRKPATPPAIRDHAVTEVLLWLDALGLRLPPPAPPRLSDRIRALAGGDLARDWPAAEVARAQGMSEATLRRRLAEEGTGLAALLADLRMNRALGLLQATDLPVQEIAFRVGYASPSRFALRFRARFGLAPSALRDDRRGTAFERQRTPGAAAAR
jgi:AraC-like DNA-binding protein